MIGVPLSGPASIPSDVEIAGTDIRSLSGTVKDANANVVALATVYVYVRDSDQFVNSAISATNGTWSMSVNYNPSGFYAIWFVNGVAVTTGVMVGPLFTS